MLGLPGRFLNEAELVTDPDTDRACRRREEGPGRRSGGGCLCCAGCPAWQSGGSRRRWGPGGHGGRHTGEGASRMVALGGGDGVCPGRRACPLLPAGKGQRGGGRAGLGPAGAPGGPAGRVGLGGPGRRHRPAGEQARGPGGPGSPVAEPSGGSGWGRPVPTPPRRASPCRRRMRTSVRCAGTAGSSSAVTAAPAPSTWPAWPPRCGRSPGEAGAPAPTGLHGDLHPLTLSGGHAGCGGACWCSSLGRGGARPRPQHPPARVATRSSQPGQQGPEGGKGGWRPKAKRGRPAPSHPTFRPRTPSTAHLYVRVRAHRDAELHPRTVHLPAPPPLATGRALSPTSARGSRGSDEGMGVQSCPACWATSPAHVSEPQGLWQ